MVPIRTYLFGGGAAVALIAGAIAAFLLITPVVSQGTLQDGTRAVAAQAPDTLDIGGPGRGDVEVPSGAHARGRPRMSLSSGRWPMSMPRARESSAVPGQVRRMR
jgi:hypothetical protein